MANLKLDKDKKAKNGEGYVRVTKSGKFECTIVSKIIDDKTKHYKKIKRTAATEAEARKLAKNAIKEYELRMLNGSEFKSGKTMLFKEYVLDYLQTQKKGKVKESAYYSYLHDYKSYIVKYKISKLQLRHLSEREFQSYYDTLTAKYAPKSISFAVQLCRATCEWLVTRHLLEENYAKQANPVYEIEDDYTVVKGNVHKSIFTNDDIKKFKEAFEKGCKSEYVPVVIFLLETGMRPQEFAVLQNSDIDIENKRVTVNKAGARRIVDMSDETINSEYYVKVTKTGKTRQVPLSPLALNAVEKMVFMTKQQCKNNEKDWLYPSFRSGNPRKNDAMEVGFKSLCDLIGVDRDVHPVKGGHHKVGLNLYACRHTCETILERNGCSPLMIGAMLGHKPETGLKHYTHIGIEDIERHISSPTEMAENDNNTTYDNRLIIQSSVDDKKAVVDSFNLANEDEKDKMLETVISLYKDDILRLLINSK